MDVIVMVPAQFAKRKLLARDACETWRRLSYC